MISFSFYTAKYLLKSFWNTSLKKPGCVVSPSFSRVEQEHNLWQKYKMLDTDLPFFSSYFKKKMGKQDKRNPNRTEATVKDEKNRNILSQTAMASNWGNTSPNPKGGVSSFRFLEEEKEQSTLFYLCGPLAQLSFSVCLSWSLFPSRYGLFTAHRCGLFSFR